jgi:hypothetical protein
MALAKLEVPIHLGNMFSVSVKDRTLATEASTLSYDETGAPQRMASELYDDAWDYGFAIQGNAGIARFCQVKTHINEDNEATHWTFRPTPESLAAFPKLAGWTVIVFND